MKKLITSFLLLVALVSVQATSISVTNGDFSTTSGGTTLGSTTSTISGGYKWNSPFTGITSLSSVNATSDVVAPCFTPTTTSIIDGTTLDAAYTNGNVLKVVAATTAPGETQGNLKITLNDITFTGATSQSTFVLKVDYRWNALVGSPTNASLNPNVSPTFSYISTAPSTYTNISNASTTYTPGTIYKNVVATTLNTSGVGSFGTATTIFNMNGATFANVNGATSPQKASFVLQIAKAISYGASGILFIDNIRFAECTAAISGVTSTTLAPYQEGSGPSAEQSFSVSGSDLLANLRVTAGSNLQISTTSGSGFVSDSLVLTQTAGTVAPTTIYTRLKAGLTNGTYNDATTKISVTSSSSVNTITAQDLQFTGSVDVATALSQITGAKLTTNNGTISIDGLAAGELVNVYDSMGKKVKSAIADGGNLKIAINAKGVYVVKIKSFSQKVVL